MKHIGNLIQLNEALKGYELVVLKFSAEWCGPCKRLAPLMHDLMHEHKNIKFFEVDVDKAPDVSAHYGVQAMPTIKFIKNSAVVSEVIGASIEKIKEALKDLK